MKNKKQLSYEDFWRNKGEYGRERVRRFLMRKERRYRNNSCPKCRRNPKQPYHTCPFSSDMYGDQETQCKCCNQCEYNCLMDI